MNIEQPVEFIWDNGNFDKNLIKHKVTNEEIEQIFWDQGKKLYIDKKHSGQERRHILLGKTYMGRKLFAVFTIRWKGIRIISVRDMSKKELKLYLNS